MLKRLLFSVSLAGCLAFVAIFARPTTVHAYTNSCYVINYTYAYDSGNQLLGSRIDQDQWSWGMSLYDCTVNLAQVRVKQWGNEVCGTYGAEYVTLDWSYTYFDGSNHYGNRHQQYDCDDLP
jgi:hypothetical protein